MSRNLYDEVMTIASEVTEIDGRLIQKLFREKGWDIKGNRVKVLGEGKYEFDAFKDKTAVEIELGLHDSTFKDYFKFLAGHLYRRVDVGGLLVRMKATNAAQPYYSLVCYDIIRFRQILRVPILAIGIPIS